MQKKRLIEFAKLASGLASNSYVQLSKISTQYRIVNVSCEAKRAALFGLLVSKPGIISIIKPI